MKKTILKGLAALVLSGSLIACGNSKDEKNNHNNHTSPPYEQPVPPEETPTPEPQPSLELYLTGVQHSVNSQDLTPEGIFFDNGFWYLTGIQNKKVFKYNPDWTYTGENFDVNVPLTANRTENFPTGIFKKDNKWFIGNSFIGSVFSPDIKISQVNRFDEYFNLEQGYDLPNEIVPRGIYSDGTDFWIADNKKSFVYKFDSSFNLMEEHDLGGEMTDPIGLYFESNFWWVLGLDTDRVHKYNLDWSYTGESFDAKSAILRGRTLSYGNNSFWAVNDGTGIENKVVEMKYR